RGRTARARVAVFGGELGERQRDIELGDRGCGSFDARRVSSGEAAQLFKNLALDSEDFLLGLEDFPFEILQLRGSESFRVDQGLLALITGRREMEVRFRNFDVVAENVVEPNLEGSDTGASALALLDLREVGAAVARDVAQLVEAGIEAVADGAAVGEVDGRLGGEGREDLVAHFGDFV